MLSWYDPLTRCGAFHHLDFQIFRKRACVWSWIAINGVVTSRYQVMTLPLESYDPADFQVGALSMQTIEPLQSYAFQARHPASDDGNGATADIIFKSFTQPLYLTMNEQARHDPTLEDVGPSRYQQAATGHYETLGRVEGVVIDAAGRSTPVSAMGFHDHSWGPRDYASLTAAHRWIYAVFGDDLFMDSYTIVTDAVPAQGDNQVHHPGEHHYGFVWDHGSFQRIERLRVSVNVAHDGHTPLDCDVQAWCVSGRGYHFTGSLAVSSVSTHHGSYFCTDALGEFRAGHRLGTGLVGLRNRHRPSAHHRHWLSRFDPGGDIGW